MSTAVRYFLISALCFIWGSTWLVIKIGLTDLPPFLSAGVRFTGAAIILLVLARVQKVALPRTWQAHLGLFGIGVCLFGVSYGVVYWVEQYLTSGLTAVIFATYPFMVLLLAHGLIPAEPITSRKAIGVIIGFLGVVLIFQSDLTMVHPRALVAAFVMLASPVAASINSVTIKRWGGHLHPYNLTMLPMTYGAICLLAISWATEDIGAAKWTPIAIGSVVYLTVFGSVIAFVAYYTLLKQVDVSLLALISYVFPVVAVILGYLVLGETMDSMSLLGSGAIVIGIAVATSSGRRRATRRDHQ